MKFYEQWIGHILDTLQKQALGSPCRLVLLEPEDFTFRTFMRFNRDLSHPIELLHPLIAPAQDWVVQIHKRLSLLEQDRFTAASGDLDALVSGRAVSMTNDVAHDLLRSIAAPPFAFVAGAYFAAELGIEPRNPIAKQIEEVKKSIDRGVLKVDRDSSLFRFAHQSYENFEFLKNGCGALYNSLFKHAFPDDYKDYTFYFFPLLAHGMFWGNLFVYGKLDFGTDTPRDLAAWVASELPHFQYLRFRDGLSFRTETTIRNIADTFAEALHRAQPGIAVACRVSPENQAVTAIWCRQGSHSDDLAASAFPFKLSRTIDGGLFKNGLLGEVIRNPAERWNPQFLSDCGRRGLPLAFGLRFRFQETDLELYYTGPASLDARSIFSIRLHAQTMLDALKREHMEVWKGDCVKNASGGAMLCER